VTDALERSLHFLSQPTHNRRLRQIIFAILTLWALQGLAKMIWLVFPGIEPEVPPASQVLNPVSAQVNSERGEAVAVELMKTWHLFGEAGSAAAVVEVAEEPTIGDPALDGIEQGARETRLNLILRGVVASSIEGAGHAIIEHKKQQAVYALDDRLPVAGRVTLVKVMPRQVVLDNGGTYELLTLFEETALDGQIDVPSPASKQPALQMPASVDKREDIQTSRLAGGYRDKLYQDPQSLASVVQISAVRDAGQLVGYRVGPGKDSAQFEQLGFKRGDLVTAVNGVTLSDPANTVRIYQTLRSANEAVFELERGGQSMTIAVGLQ